ncbi:MAG: hypothetical protein A2W90_10745 [Bacteroidetes bacterium GWF2_42_66]|nr:MAG: hypothetical protein A2W92_09735 [Bacteroidetes bacterium GWA2_42_15]OFY01943.1 MAG: hypothetical protein A2W89_23825 [Bacteroidetes bacterium GWE2_42_39]OFY44761.1 MAG: hypothetical protein A2W90_10745 [Bacteroidetes bacterium GWF2_42_66]HBL75885.1 hypothetical protein [Prolixibacteraceae bacterium]HCR89130.1 hypothetical protein [Prolixibacteraceae bacterium]
MIVIYSTQITNRLSYTLELIFKFILKSDFRLTDNKDEFILSSLPKINYSDEDFGVGLFLKSHSLLFETTISQQKIVPFTYENQWCFFPSTANSFLPFDVFACSFYLASRYEEYLFSGTTEHGRFPANESIQFKNGVLGEPLVNQWAQLLVQRISETYSEFPVPKKEFHFQMTIDVDNAWAYKNKTAWIQFGGLAKSILRADFSGIKKRFKVFSGNENDPYDSYSFIEKTFEGKEDGLKFFFLLGDRGPYDKNISHRNPELQMLIRRLAQKFEIGIHPSYASNSNNRMVATEKRRLEDITGKPVSASRQHFLMLNLPKTYETLIESGITHDFTMGYSDAIGFRAGLCTPFLFFNLEKNNTTGLTVYPLNVMDVTFKDYLEMNPEQALKEVTELMQKVKLAGGVFTCLWHNESLSDQGIWEGWKDVFQQISATGLQLENE